MISRSLLAVLLGSLCLSSVALPAISSEIQPHRALYALSLGGAKNSSGVLGASGFMTYEWGETCSGWTVEQRFRLRLEYADQDGTEINSNLVTWESKDGNRYRFNQRRIKNGQVDEEIRGEAHLNKPRSYLLGFDSGSTKLSTAARAAIDQAVEERRKQPSYNVLVVGHGAGPPAAKSEDERLSKQRAETVRAELIHSGVPATAIKVATDTSGVLSQPAAQESGGKPAEHRVEIVLEPTEQGGSADFVKPEQASIPLKADVLFPTAHTLYLIERAKAGDSFVVRDVFDGTSVDNAPLVSAVVVKPVKGGGTTPDNSAVRSPLLDQPGWRMRLAFFPAENKSEEPDYELGMRLLANGVSDDMTLDYGDYTVRARLERLEPLPRPAC